VHVLVLKLSGYEKVSCVIFIACCISLKLFRLIKLSLNDTYSKVHIGKHMSDTFHIQKVLKREMVLATALQLCFQICH